MNGSAQIAVRRAVDFLVFEGLDETLRLRIVVRRCHADASAALFELRRVVVRCVLRTPRFTPLHTR